MYLTQYFLERKPSSVKGLYNTCIRTFTKQTYLLSVHHRTKQCSSCMDFCFDFFNTEYEITTIGSTGGIHVMHKQNTLMSPPLFTYTVSADVRLSTQVASHWLASIKQISLSMVQLLQHLHSSPSTSRF